MKTLLTTANGGQPVYLDTLRRIMEMHNERLIAVIRAFSYTPTQFNPPTEGLIINGCIFSGNYTPGFTWTAGVVFINGQFYSVAANPTPIPLSFGSEVFAMVLSTGFDSAGLETYQDASTHDTFGINIATPTVFSLADPALAGKFWFSNTSIRLVL